MNKTHGILSTFNYAMTLCCKVYVQYLAHNRKSVRGLKLQVTNNVNNIVNKSQLNTKALHIFI